MNMLAIESTGKIASVAVMNLEQNKILGLTSLNSGYTHSQTLLPMIRDLLRNLNLGLMDYYIQLLSQILLQVYLYFLN